MCTDKIILKKELVNRGFTLIELLVVIAIIAILATVVFVALNPAKRFADSRNSRRWSDVENILTAVHEYIVDNKGSLPTGVSTSEQQLGTCASGGATLCTTAQPACLDLSTLLAGYLKTMPRDPKSGTAVTTGYSVVADVNNIITIKSCAAESMVIQMSR
jgi:prepilin-type N-terminal cleavage/methylation domain-containing protein